VKAFLNLIVENDEPLNMKRVVAAAGMSARTFQRQLSKEGASFSDLLADVRRNETLERLKVRNVTIAAIATDLGYTDPATFTRAFRRWTGVPPSRFRAAAS
jgi:AraC-like DNA-binding protein